MADEAPAEAAPTPETASEIPATTPETAPVTTPSVEVQRDSAGKVAGGVEGYLAEKNKALGPKAPVPVETAPATTTEEETPAPAATATTETSAATAETPVASAETPAAPAAAATPAAGPVEEEGKKPDRIRIGGLKDGHLVASANEIARAEGISFAEAFERVKPKTVETPASSGTQLRSRTDVQADLETARKERRDAASSADKLEAGASGKMVEAEEKIEELRGELEQIGLAEEQAAQHQEQTARTEFGRVVVDSKTKAAQYWPESAVEGSDFSNRMIELSDQYEADPELSHHVFEADAPFFFAKLVGKEQELPPAHLRKKVAAPAAPAVPVTQPSTPQATRPAPVAQRAVVRSAQPAAGPASGSARTSQEAPKVDLGIDKIRSVTDYENVKKRVLAGT